VVERIARENDVSKAEVLRIAIEFLREVNEARKEGMRVGAWKENDGHRYEREFIGRLS